MPQGWEWLIILAIALLLFGGTKLAGLGKASGRAIREFKEETKAVGANKQGQDQQPTQPPAQSQGTQQPMQYQPQQQYAPQTQQPQPPQYGQPSEFAPQQPPQLPQQPQQYAPQPGQANYQPSEPLDAEIVEPHRTEN